jgi:lipopolysaccharide transport system permease protein
LLLPSIIGMTHQNHVVEHPATAVAADRRASVLEDLVEIVRDLRASRSLIAQLTLRDIKVRYKQALMGFAWAVLSPVLIIAAGIVVRLAIARMSGRPLELSELTGVVVKGLAWGFVTGAIGFATTALTGNAHLITKVYFPRETLPLSIVLASTFDSLVGATALGLMLPFAGWRPTWGVLWLPVLAVILFTLTLGIALLVSCANLFFRDVKYIVQVLITFGVFFTPVFYEPAVFGPRWIPLQMANPVAPLLEGLRLSVVHGQNLLNPLVLADGSVVWTPAYLCWSIGCAAVAFIGGALVFHRAHFRFAEYV